MEAIPISLALIVACTAGLASFLSPCVLPLVPSYLSFITGMSLEQLSEENARRPILTNTLLFVFGFTAVFVAMGASATFLGRYLQAHAVWPARFGGVVLIVLGAHVAGVLRLSPLLRERRFHFSDRPSGRLGTVLVGIAFGAGWTPCLGPVLGGILTLASTSESVAVGTLLLGAYSAGLAIPFVCAAFGVEALLRYIRRFGRLVRVVEVTSGIALVFLGLLLLTGSLTALTAFLYRFTPEFLLDFEYWMLERVG